MRPRIRLTPQDRTMVVSSVPLVLIHFAHSFVVPDLLSSFPLLHSVNFTDTFYSSAHRVQFSPPGRSPCTFDRLLLVYFRFSHPLIRALPFGLVLPRLARLLAAWLERLESTNPTVTVEPCSLCCRPLYGCSPSFSLSLFPSGLPGRRF